MPIKGGALRLITYSKLWIRNTDRVRL